MGKNKSLTLETVAQITRLHKAGHQTEEIIEEVGGCECSLRNWNRCIQGGGGVNVVTIKSCHVSPKTPLKTRQFSGKSFFFELSKPWAYQDKVRF